MIEFKQIIGRGTRTFDGKDFFTIYDFVRAQEHFVCEGSRWTAHRLHSEEPRRRDADWPLPGLRRGHA
jgi:type I restriction enzyme R subunit